MREAFTLIQNVECSGRCVQLSCLLTALSPFLTVTPTPRLTVAHSTRRKGAKLWDTSLTHDRKISISCLSRYRSTKREIDLLIVSKEDEMPRHSNGKRQVCYLILRICPSFNEKMTKALLFRLLSLLDPLPASISRKRAYIYKSLCRF